MNRQFARLVALVAERDYMRTVRRRGFLAGTLLLPLAIVMIFVVSTLASTVITSPSGPIVVVNESQVPISADTSITPNVRVVPRSEAEQLSADGSISEYYLVPSEWPESGTILIIEPDRPAGSQPTMTFARRATQQAEVDALLRIAIIRAAGLPDAVVAELIAPITYQAVTDTGQPSSEADIAAAYLVPYAFTLIFMLSIFITSGYLLQSVTEEKENRVVEILLSSIPALPLMAGKILGLGAAGLSQVAIWLATALIALPFLNQQFSVNVSISPVTLVLAVIFFGLGYLSYGAIYAAIGALAPGAREAQQYASFFGFIAVIPIVLLPVIFSDPGSLIVIALCLLPLTAPAAMLAVLVLAPEPPWLLIAASLVCQILFVVLSIVAAGRIFRATLLLYGVRPSVRQLTGAMFSR